MVHVKQGDYYFLMKN
jgi:hypothetical protein